jgi:protein phosphatase 1D
MIKVGVPRVVWNRPYTRLGYTGPVRISADTEEIPFLAAGRCLGDLWGYDEELDEFVVSPEPDVGVIPVEAGCNRCLIFGTHGLLNVLSPNFAVAAVQEAEGHNNEKHVL